MKIKEVFQMFPEKHIRIFQEHFVKEYLDISDELLETDVKFIRITETEVRLIPRHLHKKYFRIGNSL